MRRLADRLMLGIRVVIIAWSVLALIVSGAFAAQRLYAEQYLPELPRLQSDADILDSKPDPAEASGGMTAPEGGHPSTEQLAWLHAVIALPSGGDRGAFASDRVAVVSDISLHVDGECSRTLCPSPGEVDPRLARLFTLVGARPSGTS